MLRRGSKLTWLLCWMIAMSPAMASAAELIVEIVGAEADKGEIIVALFDKPELFPKTPFLNRRLSIGSGKVFVTFHDVPIGSYAVSAFLDENANGIMDRNLLGLPTERFAFSRNAVGRRAAPAFEDAKVLLGDERKTIVLTLR